MEMKTIGARVMARVYIPNKKLRQLLRAWRSKGAMKSWVRR